MTDHAPPNPQRRRLLATAALAPLNLLLPGCSPAPAAPYFPLAAGRHWTYEQIEENPLGSSTEIVKIASVGHRERDGASYWLRRSSATGSEYWLGIDGGRIVRRGLRTAVEEQPRFDAVARTVLPLAPKLGDEWELPSQPFILERAVPFRERFLHHESVQFKLAMSVVAVDAEITVPAGTFRDCVRVEGSALIHVLADPMIGASEVPVRQTEWYAPGVGLVKLHRVEPLDTTQIVGGEVTLQLIAYDH